MSKSRRGPCHPAAALTLARKRGGVPTIGRNPFIMLTRRAEWLLLMILLLSCSACATFDVNTEYEAAADFSRYKTFVIADPADIGEERTADEAVLKDRIEPAISKQLRARGLRRIDTNRNADLSVYYWVNVTATQRRAWRSGYGRGPSYGGAISRSYREGTLVLDLVEPTKNALVWRATINAPLKDSRSKNLDLAVKAVEQAFDDYPPEQHLPR
jgi:hypothetical protein